MPRKKTKKPIRRKSTQVDSSHVKRKPFFSTRWTESYSSFLLGVVAVIVAVLFVVTLIRSQHPLQQTSSLSTGPTPTSAASPTPGSTVRENGKSYYIVKPDDSLWTIAQSVYNDGDRWVDIAQANNLADPGTIFTGDKLLLPNAPQPNTFGQMQTKIEPSNAISGNSYTVQKGDNLWDIAVRAYADGYQWTKIAQANNLANPDMIFSGNVLTLPR